MKQKIILLLVFVSLLCMVFAFPALSDVDYDTIYESAIKLAGNDLTNLENVRDAVEMLGQTGSYSLSKSYSAYFKQVLLVQSEDPGFDDIIQKLELCKMIRPFEKDLAARGLPSCSDLIAYTKARQLEKNGKPEQAIKAYKSMMTLDALDRIIALADTVPNTSATVRINSTNFPDKVFRSIVNKFDRNKDKELSKDELDAVKIIDCEEKGIGSLKGIEYFTALEELNCSHNNLKVINVNANTELRVLNIGFNELTSLILDNDALTEVHSSRNQIVDLDVSRCVNLEVLLVTTNQLSVLDISHNIKLRTIFCNNNQLSKLDTSKNTNLLALECANNKLTKLNLKKNKKLERLRCSVNQITELNISNCANLIKAEKEGTRTLKNGIVEMLYRVPGRDEAQDEGDTGTVRDTNCYGIYMDEALKLITK